MVVMPVQGRSRRAVAGTVVGGLVLALIIWIVSRYVSKIDPTWQWLAYAGPVFVLIVSLIGGLYVTCYPPCYPFQVTSGDLT